MISVAISGLPAGASLYDATSGGNAPIAVSNGGATLTPAELSGLTLSGAPLAPGATLPLTVTATANETPPPAQSTQSPPDNSVPPQPADVSVFPEWEDLSAVRAISNTEASASAGGDVSAAANLVAGTMNVDAEVTGGAAPPVLTAGPSSGADQAQAHLGDTVTIIAPPGYSSPIPVTVSLTNQANVYSSGGSSTDEAWFEGLLKVYENVLNAPTAEYFLTSNPTAVPAPGGTSSPDASITFDVDPSSPTFSFEADLTAHAGAAVDLAQASTSSGQAQLSLTLPPGFTFTSTSGLLGASAAQTGTLDLTAPTAQPSEITGTQANQATTDEKAIAPFAGVTITDPNSGSPTDTVTITLTGSGGSATDANGTLSGAGLSKTGTGTYALAATNPATLSSELDALTFTPIVAAGQTTTTGFTLSDTNSAGQTATASTSVTDTAPAQPSTVTVPAADQARTSTGLATVTPFTGASIADPNPGSPSETVTVTPRPTSIGTLADPNQATDGSTSSGGAITLKGSAGAVTTDLDALTFTPAYGQSGTTSFSIADLNSAGQVATPGTAAVTVDLPTITPAQLQQVGGDLIQFYKDTAAHASTTADASKLAGDVTALDLSQAELGQVLGQTLSWATLASAAATTLGNDIAATYYPKITADLAHGGPGLATDLTAMVGTTAGVAVDDLARVHSGQSASAALAATIQDYKLA